MTPANELERLLATRGFGPQHYPEALRLMRETPLVFLLPYHPEIMGEHTLKEGDALPKFVVWQDKKKGERQIPIFTSAQCANEACRKTKRRDHQYAFGEMEGRQLFDLLRQQPDAIVLNPACSTQSLYLDRNTAQKLADGSILEHQPGARTESDAQIVPPADYPTSFLQPLFQFLRERPVVKAAWLFRILPPGPHANYLFVLKTGGFDPQLPADFNIVAKAACPENTRWAMTLLDPNNAQLVQVTNAHTPFYAAPDYKASTGGKEPGKP